ncbi:MAG: S-layer homology domain-containing protein [Candidatus Melainabacteria bacterium]|uniref:S-layer homology domain-containing protein n=1 Tax=Candidatus Obscuribacter phosphatis TaxID=1906157 RepID=A0A8J7PHU2_9BACT|nr:S-layer homology domain-containing protein [Candidatus Obscuribacter phosphatis]MCA0313038.1 S-layer homology domain-containing protein [Candidatus Melainabacteria bacterium]
MKVKARLAATLALVSVLMSGATAQAQLGGIDLSQIPALLDVEGRRTQLEKAVNDAVLAGRLSSADADSFKKELNRIKDLELGYKASGKFSIWQKTRLGLELDVISSNLEKSLGERKEIGLTDIAGKQADLTARLNAAQTAGRLSTFEVNALLADLNALKTKESTFKAASGGALSNAQTLELALDLDKLSSKLESQLKARSGADVDYAARRTELRTRLKDLVTTGRMSQSEADTYTQELNRIESRETSLKATGAPLTVADQLSLALDLERVNSALERYTGATATGMPGIDAMQQAIEKKIADNQAAGKFALNQYAELKQEFDRINQVESNYRADGSLSDSETLTLSNQLEALDKRIDTVLSSNAPTPGGGLSAKQSELVKKLDSAKAAQRLTDAQYQDFKNKLDQNSARERLFRADGVLSDYETLSLANELDTLSAQITSSLTALPDLSTTRSALEKKLQDGLASGRLSPSAEPDVRADLSRVSQLESAFKSGSGNLALNDEQIAHLSREYAAIGARLDKSMAALPDVAAKKTEVTKQITEGEASGVLTAAQVQDMRKELDRIATVEASFRASDNAFTDWEVMTVNRDLDRLNNDIVRLKAAHPVAPVQTANAPFDTKGHWAESYVGQLTQRSIIGGFPDGSFKPDDGITRAQFAAIAMKALNVPPAAGAAQFKDVSPTYWASKAIAAVSQAGLVTGFPDGTFKPEDKITRAQALVILAKALPSGLADVSILNSYQDGSSVPSWAAPSVAKAAKARIIVSYPDPSQIRPNLNASRADVAALTYQTLVNLGQKLPVIKVGLEK